MIEKFPEFSYDELVTGKVRAKSDPEKVIWAGFPGPAGHRVMYNQLKHKSVGAIRRDFVTNGRTQRIMFFTGIRISESSRRASRPEISRDGSEIWVSPIIHFTSEDMVEYREAFSVPKNEVNDMLHMSGECLCGAFAKPNELEQIRFFFPEVAEHIEMLEREVKNCGMVQDKYCRWGWKERPNLDELPDTGPLCSTCDNLFLERPDDAGKQTE